MKSKARFILSRKKLLEQYKIAKDLADDVSYSLKTNPFVGSVLENETSCLFSVHSKNLLKEIKDKSRVWFFAQAWDKEELNELFSLKIDKFVVDNEEDLQILLDYIKKENKGIDLMLRMRLKEKTIHTGKHFVFGMNIQQINKFIPELRKNKLIKKLGIHFHRKTQNISEWSLKEDFLESLDEKIFDLIGMVDIGGGLPVDYKNSRAGELLPNIFKKIKELKRELEKKNIKMIIEPGRFLAAPCIKLECYIKNIYDNNIIVDTSVYNSAMDTFVAHVRMEIKGELEKGDAYTIKGMTPDSMDILRYRVYLKNPKLGDKITFLNAGAYTFSTDFCGLERLKIVIDE
jgi:ornithine decarboxylase